MPNTDDDTPRGALPAPTAEELAAVDAELQSNPLELWRQRQTWLTILGFDPGPVDGAPGRKTQAAVRAFQTSEGLDVDGKWGPKTQAAIVAKLVLEAESPDASPVPTETPTPTSTGYQDFLGAVELDAEFWACFADLTAISNVADDEGRLRRKGTRAWSALTRIVWHQTAFTWKPYRELVAARRYSGHSQINAHACFDTDGTILLLHPLASYLWTANAFNPTCLSFEIMGNFEGLLGSGGWYKPEKFGRARPKRIQLLRSRQMTKWLLDPTQGPSNEKLIKPLLEWRKACAKLGRSPIKWVNTHREGTDDRGSDCGSECWYHIGEHTIATYPQVTDGPLAGKGQPIPAAWRLLPVVPPLPL